MRLQLALALTLLASVADARMMRPRYRNTAVPDATCAPVENGELECSTVIPRPPGGWKVAGWRLGAIFGRRDEVRCNVTLIFDGQMVWHFNRDSINQPAQEDVVWLPLEDYYTPNEVRLGVRAFPDGNVEQGCRGNAWLFSDRVGP